MVLAGQAGQSGKADLKAAALIGMATGLQPF